MHVTSEGPTVTRCGNSWCRGEGEFSRHVLQPQGGPWDALTTGAARGSAYPSKQQRQPFLLCVSSRKCRFLAFCPAKFFIAPSPLSVYPSRYENHQARRREGEGAADSAHRALSEPLQSGDAQGAIIVRL